MKNKFFKTFMLFLVVASFIACTSVSKEVPENRRPNIILFFTDDQGYADIGCFGAENFETPNLDQLAQEGMKFTDFYVAASICTPSRYALLTGCYPVRNYTSLNRPANSMENGYKITEIDTSVYDRVQKEWIKEIRATKPEATFLDLWHGINDDEITIAEVLKSVGYSTAMYGKWDVGRKVKFSPLKNGFNEYLVTPNSHDVGPECTVPVLVNNNIYFPRLPFIENDSIIEYDPDYNYFTKRSTDKALDFIERNKNSPFFIYMAYNMPHVPLGVTPQLKGKSGAGIYGDVINEIDHSVGRITKALENYGLEENTLIIFTSDNGPFLIYGDHAGNAGQLRGGKNTLFEGGVRVPCIMKWPDVIKPGTAYSKPLMTIDVLPTFADITGAALPQHTIDGKSFLPVLSNPEAPSPHEAYYFYLGGGNNPFWGDAEIKGVRRGKWKLLLPHEYHSVKGKAGGKNGIPVEPKIVKMDTALYNLETDISESNNVKDKHPDIVKELLQAAQEYDKQLKENQRSVSWITR